eukprot:CAMPEP_0172549490 /NCGR_PEP_ID=MMETSP1067-20121228/18562_1 /TAXON_ID=265564 ORGANISM="Thalassiosira punctigera, Strain Tpunct2005C2" /NCGR_SAMPLE_ID=MMETSP1067 /ASSEMBLY_ACC=CAM_ASM_000444 /LENGTH=375 /DNA_ID=CAMNT_0013336881 /DNA_START=112 /DNA_END=1239 /DNA_ORIENTATION=-
MAIPAMLDGQEAKYSKKSSTYRTRTQTLLCVILLPAAATVTTDVWFQSAILSSTFFGYDLVLACTNVSGAFLDGFFSDWESGSAIPSGAKTEALYLIANDMRAFYLSTYTSWAGMVGVAASMAHGRSSVLVGFMYILLSILCAFVAHGLGSDFARYISSPGPITKKPYVARAHKLLHQFMTSLLCYILLSYLYLGGENIEDSDEVGDKKFLVTATPRNQLAVSTIFAVLGANVGHILANIISKSLKPSLIPMETLICNALFGLLSLSLNAFKLSNISWGESLILRGFAINFCGAASLFARHASDNQQLYAKKWGGLRQTGINIAANISLSSLVFWVAFEIEEWVQPGEKRRGMVVKIMKILEKRRIKLDGRQSPP